MRKEIHERLDDVRRKNEPLGRVFAHVTFKDAEIYSGCTPEDHERVYDRELALEVGDVLALDWHKHEQWYAVTDVRKRFIEWHGSKAALVQFITCERVAPEDDAGVAPDDEVPIR